MARFLCALLDALFELWEEREQLELPVFDVIVALFKLTDEQRYNWSVAVLEKYLEIFPYCNAAIRLMRCLNHYITSASTNNNEKTRNALKVMGHIFRTVIHSKKSGISFLSDSFYGSDFQSHFDSVLDSLVQLMGETKERMTVQNTALKYLPTIVDPICVGNTYEPCNLANICSRFFIRIINAFGRNIVAQRAMECAAIISNLLERLFSASVGSPMCQYGTDEELNLIINATYRPLVQAMVEIGQRHKTRSSRGYQNFLRPSDIDKMDFILEMLQMIQDLLCRCPFPSTWQQMIMLQNKIIHKALRFLMNAIQGYFSNEREKFYSDVWQEYMLTAVCFVTQQSLQFSDEWLHDDTDSRVQLRKAAARDLRSMWFRLTPLQKMTYIPRLVGAFLKVALVEDDETREATIPIFFDMMQCEFHSCPDDKKNFRNFSDELIAQLDSLVDQDRGTRAFQEQFTKILTSQCQSDKELWEGGGKELIDRVDRLLGHLFEYRLVRETADCMENGMSRTVQLLRYYEKYNHHHLYVTYVYKLYDLHILYNNQIEAAKTLLLHASTLRVRIAELYRKIDRESRAFFYYYLVAFYGKGFPSYLNGISFIFRSDKLERHADFMQRMQQICDFEYSRVEERRDTKWTAVKDSELMRTWIAKRIIVTHERLPGILRSTQIISTSLPIYVSPLRRSVDQMQRKNAELMETAVLVLLDRVKVVKKLSGEILGVVRPAVMGGVSNYEVRILFFWRICISDSNFFKVFFSDECARIYDFDEKQMAMHLSALIIEQRSILPPGTSIKYSAESTDIDASRKMVTNNALDTGLGGTLNLRSRGAAIGCTMLNMLTTSRKSSNQTSRNNTTSTSTL
ncbi:hypothetical protein DICVIV_07574 [Dictyocaulus viviparus]|uniref:DOCKER domain-containing protein n=1 Tax=Dictyocaulus viviparus TaxID=29172 RepID=A0A0D8XRL2_DICVI|nr:hypothetical protein DICVIV_07574 [Dictyocaulus viviparus]